MLIPSIDLMGGRIVQLVQGEKLKLAFDDFDYWIERFAKYPMVQLIDLDAARGTGDNRALVREIAQRLNCQVGGGIRSVEAAQELLRDGAKRVIIGSALLREGKIDAGYAEVLAGAVGPSKLVFALDSLPAVLAVTHDAAIAISSNLFAILGLRSLFFVVSGAMKSLRYLGAGLAAILSFVGIKMIAEPWHAIPTGLSLAVIAALLLASIGASVVAARAAR